jgi:hypothetical protein
MNPATADEMRIECTECHFSATEDTAGERLPADIITDHGRETGHNLSVTPTGKR